MESLLKSSVRSFLKAFFAILGILLGIIIVLIAFVGVVALSEEESFSSSVKILPDADGHRKELSHTTPVLLQISIEGKIGDEDLTARKIENVLLKSREEILKNDRVKGILLVINSPGGGANDSDIIYRLLKHYKEKYKVPIYTYVDGLCASGGYYIACASDKIYASEVSIIGSVGVLAWPPFLNLSDTISKLGMNALTLSAGKGKDELNPLRPWKENEQEPYQQLINFLYGRFVEIVVENRPIQKETLVGEIGAKVFPAPLAKDQGYVDVVGASRADVVKALALKAGLKEDEKYQVITFETKGWMRKLLTERSPIFTGKVHHEIDFNDLKERSHSLEYYYSS